MRAIVAVIGGLLAAGALMLATLCVFPAAIMLAVWAAILLIGLLVERWRYKRLAATPPGPDWQRTDERFVDPETGKLVTVYFHPRTGERRYIGV
ncbi:MAG TPA: hypothetical protein VGS13_09255 [Stellaceae bacterium]|nr:hypothetical protein [Stellaceae bacterium]